MAVLGGEDCNDLLVAGGTLKEVEELLGRTFITPAEQEHLRDQLLGSVTQTSPFDWIPDVSVLKVLDGEVPDAYIARINKEIQREAAGSLVDPPPPTISGSFTPRGDSNCNELLVGGWEKILYVHNVNKQFKIVCRRSNTQ